MSDHTFLGLCFTDSPGTPLSHDPLLVAVSLAIAGLSSFAALDMVDRARQRSGGAWRWLVPSSFTLGAGIWSVHFIGMLALYSPIPLNYAPPILLLSLLVAIVSAGGGLYVAASTHASWPRLAIAGTAVGLGIVGMHYLGMASLLDPVGAVYTRGLWLTSVLIGAGASIIALATANRLTTTVQRSVAALTMGVGICGLHYAGMAATTVRFGNESLPVEGVDARTMAAAVVAIAVGLAGLAIASTVADRRIAAAAEREVKALRKANHILEWSQQQVLQRLSIAGEWRDDDTAHHVKRIAVLAQRLALTFGADPAFADDLFQAAPLHDIGKIGIPDAILRKPGKLTEPEMAIMRRHSEIGARMLVDSGLPLLNLAAEIALTHHEKWNGSGYPSGLAGEAIPLSGRIVALVDVFDALMSRRPYKEPWPLPRVEALLSEQSGQHFDPDLTACFLNDIDTIMVLWTQHLEPADASPATASDLSVDGREASALHASLAPLVTAAA